MPELKLEDEEILSERPVEVCIGKKKIVLRLLTAHEYFVKFAPKFLAFLLAFGKEIGDLEFPTGRGWRRRGPVEKFRRQLTAALSSERLRRGYFALLREVGIVRMSRRYFERHVTVPDYVRIFLHVYRFNVDGIKKNVELAILEVLNRDSLASTGSSPGVDGLPPGEYKVLKPRFLPSKKSRSRSSRSSSSGDGNGKRTLGKKNGGNGRKPGNG